MRKCPSPKLSAINLSSLLVLLLVASTNAFSQTFVKYHATRLSKSRLDAHATRRNVLQTIASSSLLAPQVVHAADTTSSNLETGLLEVRVLENLLSPPPYGMEGNDIYYPSYFNGVWNVLSTTTDIQAPCGVALFGGNSTYVNALNEVNTSLNYKSRFVPSAQQGIIADREYNVVEIAKAAMGKSAVLDVPLSTPNKVSVMLAFSNQILRADLLTLNRRAERIDDCEFHCSEVVRQVIAPAKSSPGSTRSTLLKEIETASLYTAIKDEEGHVKEIRCRQRSATFLLPSQQDPYTYKMWEASRGRPIDVRFYDVLYTKRE